MSNISSAAAVAALLLFAAACDEGPTALPDLTVASVSVAPAGQTIEVGQTMQMTAFPKTADGTLLGGRLVEWSSDDDAIATVSANGTVTGGRAGATRVRATVEGKTGSVEVTVVSGPLEVAEIEIANAPARLGIGEYVVLEAILRAADGTVIGGRSVTWRSSHGPTASITRDPNPVFAVLSAHAAGTVMITAEAEGRAANVTVTVNPPAGPVGSITLGAADAEVWVNGTYPFAVTVRTPAGDPHPSPPVLTWSVDDPTVAQVDGNGRVRGLRPGTTNVRATAGGTQGSAKITVRDFLAEAMQLSIQAGVDADGTPRVVEIGTLTWYCDDPVNGTPAREILKSGSLSLQVVDGVVRYSHQIRFDVVVDDGGAGRLVANGSISDAGIVASSLDPNAEGPMLTFTSDHAQNDTFYGRVINGDRLVLRQRLGAAPVLEYGWVRQ